MKENLGGAGFKEFDLPRLRVPTGGELDWKTVAIDGEITSEDSTDVIIAAWKTVRMLWPHEYGKGPKSPPVCKSDDGITGTGEPGGSCLTCPKAKYADGKTPCREAMALFLLRPGSALPNLLMCPLMSIKKVRCYFTALTSQLIVYRDVVTRLELEQATNAAGIKYSTVKLSLASKLSEEHAAIVKRFSEVLKPIVSKFQPTQDDMIAAGEQVE